MNNKANGAIAVIGESSFQELYEAALDALLRDEVTPRLEEAVRRVEERTKKSKREACIIQLAKDMYEDVGLQGRDETQIDKNELCIIHHNGDEGYWVSAWVYVHDPDAEEP